MPATTNGCTCADVHALAARDGGPPMSRGWSCVACQARERARIKGAVCRKCGEGLLESGDICTSCEFD